MGEADSVGLPPRLPRSGGVEDGCLVWPPVSAVRVVTCAVFLALGTGCGGHGELDAGALLQQAKSLQSVSAEGALLAHDAASGKLTGIYSGEHSAELRGAAAQIAASLQAATTTPALATRLRMSKQALNYLLGELEHLHYLERRAIPTTDAPNASPSLRAASPRSA